MIVKALKSKTSHLSKKKRYGTSANMIKNMNIIVIGKKEMLTPEGMPLSSKKPFVNVLSAAYIFAMLKKITAKDAIYIFCFPST